MSGKITSELKLGYGKDGKNKYSLKPTVFWKYFKGENPDGRGLNFYGDFIQFVVTNLINVVTYILYERY